MPDYVVIVQMIVVQPNDAWLDAESNRGPPRVAREG